MQKYSFIWKYAREYGLSFGHNSKKKQVVAKTHVDLGVVGGMMVPAARWRGLEVFEEIHI